MDLLIYGKSIKPQTETETFQAINSIIVLFHAEWRNLQEVLLLRWLETIKKLHLMTLRILQMTNVQTQKVVLPQNRGRTAGKHARDFTLKKQ